MAEIPISNLPDTLTDAVDDDDAWLAVDHVSGSKTNKSRASVAVRIGGALLKDGSVALAADLDAGGNAITNVGDVDGRDVSLDGAALDAHVAAGNPHADSAAGPASSTDNAVARFNGAGGKTLQNSPVTISDTGSIDVPIGETVDGRDVSEDGTKLDGIDVLTTQAAAAPGATEPLVGNNNAGATTLQFVDPAPPGEPADASEPYYLQLTSATPAITENVVVIGRSGTSRTLAAPLQNDFSAGDADVAYAGLATAPTEQGLMSAAEHHRLEGMATGATANEGDVVGPGGGSTDNAVARFDGVTGKLVQNSGVTIDDSGNVDVPGTLDVTGEVSAPNVKKANLSATTSPTEDDDSGDGYAVGSLWIDTTNDRVWKCVDASAGAAVWKCLSHPIVVPIVDTGAGSEVVMSEAHISAGMYLFASDTGPHEYAVNDTGLPVGASVEVVQAGDGQARVVGGAGVTLLHPATFNPYTAERGSSLVVTIVADDGAGAVTALVRGDLAAV